MPAERLLTPAELVAYLDSLGIRTSEKTLQTGRTSGGRATWPFVRLPSGDVRYRPSDIEAHFDAFVGPSFTSNSAQIAAENAPIPLVCAKRG
jgi:hypothetical protein